MIKKSLFILASLLISLQFAFADDATQVQNPVSLIQNTVNALQTDIANGGSSLANNPAQLYAIIKGTIMPIVNINQMAGLALGPKWRVATPAQQQDFINQFGQLLTKTYANAIVSISNYKITLNPMRGNAWQTAQYVSVSGQVTSSTNGQSSNLTYYLERNGNNWQIYDLAIEGVSFLKNYQEQFQSFSNMDSLIAKIDQINN